jgi:hypothetical protein
MFHRPRLLWIVLLSLTAFAADTTSDRLIADTLKSSSLETNLRRLTDEIGGRVPGTPAMQRAVDWGVAAFKEAGADGVHTEDFTIPHSWSEGETSMTATEFNGSPFKVRAVSVTWAPALVPSKHVPIMDVGEGNAAGFAKAGDVSGKIVLVHTKVLARWADLVGEYARAPAIIELAVKGKAKAIAFMATREHDILYRHCNSVHGEIDRIPMVIMAREDGERIARLLSSGHPVWADLSIPNHVGGPIKASNVIAELRGREKSDEFVVLGAHLDSWDLGTGALDNGCNAALVIDALRAIKASGAKPRRTIRFILFSGEEQGLLGSWAYVVAHRAELDRAAGVVIFDSGTGKLTDFSSGGRKDTIAAAEKLLAPVQTLSANRVEPSGETGTDHFDFMLEGVPTLVADTEETNYLENYHAVSDTFDKVDLDQLRKNLAVAAVLTLGLADSSDRIGPRLTRAQIEQTLSESHLDDEMKAMDMWDDWAKGKRGRGK